jgi:protein-S-isoprenylcysteine O-methyltransferase Ste14
MSSVLSQPNPFFWAWTAWLVYWWLSAARVKVTQRRESPGSRASYFILLLIGVALILENRSWPGWLLLPLLPRGPVTYYTGVVLLFAGLGYACWARVVLGENWSADVTIKSGHELIRTGPYRWVRHPIYTGLITALLGGAIAEGEIHSFLGVALITVSFIRKLRIEERMLRELFGQEYGRYRSETAALIPWVF